MLGALPDEAQPSQKGFESELWNTLRSMDPARPVWVESESRKIGKIQVPSILLARVRASACMRLEPPLAERVRFLIEEYAHMLADPAWLKDRLNQLAELHSREVMQRWTELIDAKAWDELVRNLLVNHYDPLYQRSMSRSYPTLGSALVLRPQKLDAETIGQQAEELLASTITY